MSDGASGIWELQQWVFPGAQPRLDQYHTKGKIGERLEPAFGGKKASQPHQPIVQAYVEQGLIDEAVCYLQQQRPRSGPQRQATDKLIGYLQRHRARLPNDQQVKADGGTVSSGLMEKANDLIVVRRLKEPIMHWTRAGADPILQHRTHFINKHARTRTGPYDLAFCHQ